QIPSNLIPFITQTAAGIRDCLTIFGKDYPTKDGTCIRDYIHIMDLASAHTKALNYLLAGKQSQKYQVFNVGTGEGTSVLEAVQFFEKITNQKLNYTFSQRRSGDVIAVYADNRLIQKELNWKASYSMEDMLSSAWEWQKKLMMKKNNYFFKKNRLCQKNK
ncbi:MAG: GDP-mannose 4,6-dehydratase, partial [Bacteroidota bacterium]